MIKITRTRKLADDDIITIEIEQSGSLESELVREQIKEKVRHLDLILFGFPTCSDSCVHVQPLDEFDITEQDLEDDALNLAYESFSII